MGALLVIFAGVQLIISSALLLMAATARWSQPPRWAQLLDVVLAFSVVVTGMIIDRAGRTLISPQLWRQSYYVATYLPLIILLALWLGQQTFDFNFLPGVAWRLWVVVYVLLPRWRCGEEITLVLAHGSRRSRLFSFVR